MVLIYDYNDGVCAAQVLYSDETVEIPRWMFSTESVHAKRMSCMHPNVSLSISSRVNALFIHASQLPCSVFVLQLVCPPSYCKHGREAVLTQVS